MNDIENLKFNTKRSFGVEIEVGKEVSKNVIFESVQKLSYKRVRSSYYHPSVNNTFWDIKHDGSCGAKMKNGINEGGYEITSYKGSGVKDLLHISKVISTLKSIKIKTNHNCGMHIHVDVSDCNVDEIGCLINNWIFIEDIMFCMVPLRRKLNKFCNRLYTSKINNNSLKTAKDYWECYKPNSTALTSGDRRMSLNLLNYFRSMKLKTFNRKTVEFRFPESTLVEKNIKNWVRLLVFFVEFSIRNKKLISISPIDNLLKFLNVVGLYDFDNKIKYSSGLLETRLWALKRIHRYANNIDIKNQAKNLIERL
jgi:hypothetical protein